MEELLKEILSEQKRTNELLMYHETEKDPNELLTIEQVHKEFNIGIATVQKMFKDPRLGAQRYTRPFKATRQAVNRYITENGGYLKEVR